MIPASSVLLVTVWDQTTAIEAVVSLSVSRVSDCIFFACWFCQQPCDEHLTVDADCLGRV
jgi:hypothetical protein